MKIAYHKSIETLPIANFEKVKKTSNLGYLYDLKFLECENKQSTPDMLKAWNNIYAEYREIISKRSTARDIIEKQGEVGFYHTENMKVKLICDQLMKGKEDDSYIEMLEESGYKINNNRDLKEQAQEIFNRSDNYITKIKALNIEIEALSKIGKEIDIEEMKGLFRQHLNLGDVNMYTTSVKEWAYYEDELIKFFDKKTAKV